MFALAGRRLGDNVALRIKMKTLFLLLVSILFSTQAYGDELLGLYKRSNAPSIGLPNEENIFPGIAPKNESIEIKEKVLIYSIGSRGPVHMKWEAKDGKIFARRQVEGSTEEVVFFILKDGSLKTEDKLYRREQDKSSPVPRP